MHDQSRRSTCDSQGLSPGGHSTLSQPLGVNVTVSGEISALLTYSKMVQATYQQQQAFAEQSGSETLNFLIRTENRPSVVGNKYTLSVLTNIHKSFTRPTGKNTACVTSKRFLFKKCQLKHPSAKIIQQIQGKKT